MPHVPLKK